MARIRNDFKKKKTANRTSDSFKVGRFLIETISLIFKSVKGIIVFCDLPFYFHRALNYLYVHFDIWARISLFIGVNIMPSDKQ